MSEIDPERRAKIRDALKRNPEVAKDLKDALKQAQGIGQGIMREIVDEDIKNGGREKVFDDIRNLDIDPDSDEYYRDYLGESKGREGFDKKYPPASTPASPFKGPKIV